MNKTYWAIENGKWVEKRVDDYKPVARRIDQETEAAAEETAAPMTFDEYRSQCQRDYVDMLKEQNKQQEALKEKMRKPGYEAMAQKQLEAEKSEYCTRCGASEAEGAMFTTLKNSGICDDCV